MTQPGASRGAPAGMHKAYGDEAHRAAQVEQLKNLHYNRQQERSPFVGLSCMLMVGIIVGEVVGAYFFPLQWREEPIKVLGHLGGSFTWQCSLLRCKLQVEAPSWSFGFVGEKLPDQWRHSMLQGKPLYLNPLTLAGKCGSGQKDNLAFAMLFAAACGEKKFLVRIAVATALCLLLALASTASAVVILIYICRDYHLCRWEPPWKPRWARQPTLRLAAKMCSRLVGVLVTLLGLVYAAFLHSLEADGGFLRKSLLSVLLQMPKPVLFSRGCVMWICFGSVITLLAPLLAGGTFEMPEMPVGILDRRELAASREARPGAAPGVAPPVHTTPMHPSMVVELPQHRLQRAAAVNSAVYAMSSHRLPPGQGLVMLV